MAQGLSVLARQLIVDRSGTTATLKAPVLVWEAPPSSSHDSGHWMMTDAGQSLNRPRAGEPLLFTVEKVVGRMNPFAMGVTVGRVDSNDIVVDDGSVSRFHAFLQYDERTDAWSLTDADSKNGTWVDGVKAEAKKRVALQDGAEVRFGEAKMVFLLPASLLRFIDERWNGSGPKRPL